MEENLNLEMFTIGGEVYQTTLTNKYKNRTFYTHPNKKEIKSFIPGTISNIKVKKGSKVKAGEELLTLEAMKMKNSIKAPFNGVIKAINVTNGIMVPKNFILVEME